MIPFDFDRKIDRAASNAEKYRLRPKLFHTDDVLPMWVADMDIATPDCVLDAIEMRRKHPVLGYEMMPDSAFEAQCAWMQKRHGVTMYRAWMRYSPSVVASINLAITAFTEPGDGIIVQTPVYPPFFNSVTMHDRQLILNPLRLDENGVYRFDLDDLRRKIDEHTKLLLLCSPHNPVGRVWEKEELEALTSICLEHDIMIFSDEIHADLTYAPHRHIPTIAISDNVKSRTITAIGPGKTFNMAGLSISTVVIAEESIKQQFDKHYKRVHFAEGTIFGHIGFEAAYREGEAWLEGLVDHLHQNAIKLKLAIDKIPGIEMRMPQGTYLAWLDCRGLGFSNDKELRTAFVKRARLGLSPGISFGKAGNGYMRLNFAVTNDTMDDAIKRLEKALS